MVDEQQFRRAAESAIEQLKARLIEAEADADFEVEEQGGVLNVVFEDPPAKFVITTNSPVRQIWISALATSFKLDLVGSEFVLAKTGERLIPLVARLVNEQSQDEVMSA
ncbi:MAG TPA: iron donor protein CyaY [Terriglobales bacterium]|nr:iron donor protein CyaY [Terriglobales bacterium]